MKCRWMREIVNDLFDLLLEKAIKFCCILYSRMKTLYKFYAPQEGGERVFYASHYAILSKYLATKMQPLKSLGLFSFASLMQRSTNWICRICSCHFFQNTEAIHVYSYGQKNQNMLTLVKNVKYLCLYLSLLFSKMHIFVVKNSKRHVKIFINRCTKYCLYRSWSPLQ